MPQPIRRPCEVQLGGLNDLSDHAAALGHIVSLSGYLETLLGHLLAYMTGAGATVTMAMFHSVTSTDAQRAMLVAAAEQIFAGAELDEFRDLMDEFKTRYRERSRLVHNMWGTSPQHPDKAIWCASKDATTLSMRMAAAQDADELDMFVQSSDGALWKKCSTYTVAEIQDVHSRLMTYTERVRLFVLKLQSQHPVIAKRVAALQAIDEQASAPQEDQFRDLNQE